MYSFVVIHSLPSIKKKILSAHNSDKDLNKKSDYIIISRYNLENKKDLTINPKITKVLKKIKCKDNK